MPPKPKPIGQIVIIDPLCQPLKRLDPLAYQTGKAQNITLDAGWRGPVPDRSFTSLAQWMYDNDLTVVASRLIGKHCYRVIIGA